MALKETGAVAPVQTPIHWQARPTGKIAAVASIILLISIILSLTMGTASMHVLDPLAMLVSTVPGLNQLLGISPHWSLAQEAVVWHIRLPRAILAALVGASLAVAGAAYQGLFRNPLAEPYLIGAAPGAGLGAVIALALPVPLVLYTLGVVQWMAFVGALVVVGIVYFLARTGGTTPVATLLLAGVALGALATSLTSFLMYMNQEGLHVSYSWLLGGLSISSWDKVVVVIPFALLGFIVIFICARFLNVLQLNEEQAALLGINVELLKAVLVIAATFITAAAVSVSGIIGFVGLIIPHAVRLVWGPDYRLLIPISALVGAIFLLWADNVARVVLAPTEIPLGVVTALCGVPFFLYLLRQRKRILL